MRAISDDGWCDLQLNESNISAAALSLTEKLALAQEAFERFHTLCFWFMRDELRVSEQNLPAIIRGLRSHGNREAFQIADRLCR